jgi:hypothetical protein
MEFGAACNQFGRPGEGSPYADGIVSGGHGMIGFSVDHFIELFKPHFPTRLKIDVDGLELAILRGAEKTIRDRRLRAVMLELSLTSSPERKHGIDLMEEAGFSSSWVQKCGQSPICPLKMSITLP